MLNSSNIQYPKNGNAMKKTEKTVRFPTSQIYIAQLIYLVLGTLIHQRDIFVFYHSISHSLGWLSCRIIAIPSN